MTYKKSMSQKWLCALSMAVSALLAVPAFAADGIEGRLEVANGPIAKATVTLWGATAGKPVRLAQTQTSSDGSFRFATYEEINSGSVIYIIAEGGKPDGMGSSVNPAITLMATLGANPPERVTVNELTTVASVWTAAQFLDGIELSGNATGLKIAAGNVPNLVDLETGGLGSVVMNPLNGPKTTTLAKFNTLGILLSACVEAKPGACKKLFSLSTPPGGIAPTDTLSAAHNIARYPAHNADKLFALLDEFYPLPKDKYLRDVNLIPYLTFAPSAWTLSLVYSGGGYSGVGGIAIDGEGNMWSNNNFIAGSQTTIYKQFGGGISKFAPNGRPLSPMVTGFLGGGAYSTGWGIAISSDEKVWSTSLIGSTISVFEQKTGQPLSPETGYNFDGKLGQMQGVAIAPNGDVWTVDTGHDQIVHMPGGDPAKGRILGRTVDGKPIDGTLQVNKPFGIAIDQQNRVWIGNSGSNTVTHFPASDPGKAVDIEVGFSPHGIAIDSMGNVWVANLIGHPGTAEKLSFVKQKIRAKIEGLEGSMSDEEVAIKGWIDLWEIINKYPGGDVSMIQPDGTVLGPFNAGGSITGPWGISVDGNDNVWVGSSTSHSISQLCGVRTETCPPELKTGDPISPAGGYIGGLEIITAVALDPAGNAWVANSWNDTDVGFSEDPNEALSTRFAANTTVVFFGLAKPVRTPLIGAVEAQ